MTEFYSCLIIDDDPEDRDLLIDVIHEIDKDIKCYTSANGEYALSVLGSWLPEKPDIIFLDLNMPRMGGRKFIEAIKQNALLDAIPIVVYTTSSNKAEKEDMMKAGANEVLTKPNNIRELKETVEGILSTRF